MAKGLYQATADQDSTEDIQLEKVSLQQAIYVAIEGKITHEPSCMLILKASFASNKALLKGMEKSI